MLEIVATNFKIKSSFFDDYENNYNDDDDDYDDDDDDDYYYDDDDDEKEEEILSMIETKICNRFSQHFRIFPYASQILTLIKPKR